MGVNQNISGLGRDGPLLAIASEALTRRFLGWRARYGRKPEQKAASDVMARSWPLRLRSFHAGFWAGERVMDVTRT